MPSLLELFCSIDDFCQVYEPMMHQMLLENGLARRQRTSRMSMSEMMTLVVHFYQKQFRNFKTYYTEFVVEHLDQEFPCLFGSQAKSATNVRAGDFGLKITPYDP
jgi:hypothetical protein